MLSFPGLIFRVKETLEPNQRVIFFFNCWHKPVAKSYFALGLSPLPGS